jgi:predicted amino acid dehydrogenase
MPAPTVLQLPTRRRRGAGAAIDYAFVVHPTTLDDIVGNDPTFARFAPHELRAYQAHAAQLPAGVVAEIPDIESPAGARVRGVLIGLPMLPEQMLARGRASVCEAIANAVALARARGARLVGLGAFSSIYTRKGVDVVGRGPWITTGNLLTAGMAFAALRRALERQGTSLADSRVGIVGARGSVGALVAALVARARPREIILVGNPATGTDALDRIARRLRALGCATLTATNDMSPLERCNAIVSASSSARPVLADARIAPGTIVCDVARPFDTPAAMRRREDIVVIDGGLVALPGTPRSIGAGNVQGQPPGIALACLAETILLALAGTARDHGVGEDLDVTEVDAMLALAQHHGFALADHAPASHLRMVCA